MRIVTESEPAYLQNVKGTSQNDHQQQTALYGKKQPPPKEGGYCSAGAGCKEARTGPPVENA
jgi:hypothetical protein